MLDAAILAGAARAPGLLLQAVQMSDSDQALTPLCSVRLITAIEETGILIKPGKRALIWYYTKITPLGLPASSCSHFPLGVWCAL